MFRSLVSNMMGKYTNPVFPFLSACADNLPDGKEIDPICTYIDRNLTSILALAGQTLEGMSYTLLDPPSISRSEDGHAFSISSLSEEALSPLIMSGIVIIGICSMSDGGHDTAKLFELRVCKDCNWDGDSKINYVTNTITASLYLAAIAVCKDETSGMDSGTFIHTV